MAPGGIELILQPIVRNLAFLFPDRPCQQHGLGDRILRSLAADWVERNCGIADRGNRMPICRPSGGTSNRRCDCSEEPGVGVLVPRLELFDQRRVFREARKYVLNSLTSVSRALWVSVTDLNKSIHGLEGLANPTNAQVAPRSLCNMGRGKSRRTGVDGEPTAVQIAIGQLLVGVIWPLECCEQHVSLRLRGSQCDPDQRRTLKTKPPCRSQPA